MEERIELTHKYRPKLFKQVIGQDEAIASLRKKCKENKIPHVILFHGPAGTGKTTLARIVARQLNCSKFDFVEKDTADYRGIDSIREITRLVSQAPMEGENKAWLLDECHKLTGDAQNALLKTLEEPPSHVYFFLCTTEPEKLLDTIKQRCTLKIRLKPVAEKEIGVKLLDICEKEGLHISAKVIDKIDTCCEGSVREAIQMLDSIRELKSEEEMLNNIEKTDLKEQVINIARLLMNKKTKWSDIAKLLKNVQNEDPETIRWMVMGYAKAILLNGDNPRAFRMLENFRDNFYDSKFNGVVAACYEMLVVE